MEDIFKTRCQHLILRLCQQATPFVNLMCNREVRLSYECKDVFIGFKILSLEKRLVTSYIFAFKF